MERKTDAPLEVTVDAQAPLDRRPLSSSWSLNAWRQERERVLADLQQERERALAEQHRKQNPRSVLLQRLDSIDRELAHTRSTIVRASEQQRQLSLERERVQDILDERAAAMAPRDCWPGEDARIYNAAAEAGICTPEQLAQLSDAEILYLPNLGRKSLGEIRQWQQEQGR
jgi:hypothetical protein